jgi:hypothetical protein
MASDDDNNVISMRSRLPGADAAFLSGFAGDERPNDDECGGALDGEPISQPAPSAPPLSLDVGAVLDRWTVEGPLRHEPTGLASLDAQTGGGLVYGTTTYLQGAPDASKTTVLIHVAHEYAARNIMVGIVAADEEASDLVTRFGQRLGFARDDLELREAGAIAKLREKLAGLPLRFFDGETTLEAAAEEIVRLAKGRRVCLCVDSIQVVRCAVELLGDRPPVGAAAVEARTIALRAIAWKYHLIALTTSEQARAAYRSRRPEDQIDPLAAGKGSGAIEYKSRVLVTMRKVPRADDVVDCFPTRNKHQRGPKEAFFLRIDRPRQMIEETSKPAEAEEGAEAAERAAEAEQRDAAETAKAELLAEQILTSLVKANARGASITTRLDLLALGKGRQRIKSLAVGLLISSGRIQGGRGKPYMPRLGDAEATPEAPADGN